MDDNLHQTLHIITHIMMDDNGINGGVIHTIRFHNLIGQDPELKFGPLPLGPHVCFAPFNCLACNPPEFGVGQSLGGGVQINHDTKIQNYPEKKIWQIENKGVPLYVDSDPNQGDMGSLPLI